VPYRKSYDFGVKIRAGVLTTIPDSTSQKFLLVGALSRKDATDSGRYVVVFLDFAPTRARKCGENDFEKWYARTAKGKQCLMGHKVRLLGSVRCSVFVFIILSNGTSDASLTPTVTLAINSTTLLDMKIIASAMMKTMNGNITVFFFVVISRRCSRVYH
jgi:hypothetical protein